MINMESSSRKVQYDLRPRKQVERRMMIHILQLLAEVGFPISTYRYAGFGAFFFVDFILFNRLLGIKNMVSIEHDRNSENRVKFNRPYFEIDILFHSASEYISAMNPDLPHILWLDYDVPINHEGLLDVESAATRLPAGSFLIVTFNVDFDKADVEIRELTADKRADAWFNLFKDECKETFDLKWKITDFNASEFYKRTIEVVNGSISSGLRGRKEISFEPLFNFIYADGHEMITMGGVICNKDKKRGLLGIDWKDYSFVRRSFTTQPFRIDVPILTRRERLLIDSKMPPDDPGWTPDEFEIDDDAIKVYRSIYKYCPLYAELLL